MSKQGAEPGVLPAGTEYNVGSGCTWMPLKDKDFTAGKGPTVSPVPPLKPVRPAGQQKILSNIF